MKKINQFIYLSLLCFIPLNPLMAEAGHDHENEAHQEATDEHGHEEEGEGEHDEGIKLSNQQLKLAKIKVVPLVAKMRSFDVYAPAEIKTNGYTSYFVSPRSDSVVLKRHVALGDKIKKGQRLVTLFSPKVAETQATFKVVQAEWLRVKKLGRKVVGDKRFIKARTDHQSAYGQLQALGLSKRAIQNFKKFGEYQLLAAGSGTILADDFHQGQQVSAGQTLIELADESMLWVEAQIKPTLQFNINKNTPVKVKLGKQVFNASVAQTSHLVDPVTRTRIIRLLVDNKGHRLHAGLFVDVYFSFASKEAVLAVPESALMRGADGDWTVFVMEKGNQFKAEEVELGRFFGDYREIKGIHAGARIVIEGAFFVASEIAKGGFDPHNH